MENGANDGESSRLRLWDIGVGNSEWGFELLRIELFGYWPVPETLRESSRSVQRDAAWMATP